MYKYMIESRFYDNSKNLVEYYRDMGFFEVTTMGSWDEFVKENPEFSKFYFVTAYKLFLKESSSDVRKRELSKEEAPFSIINIVSRKYYSKSEIGEIKDNILLKGSLLRFVSNG